MEQQDLKLKLQKTNKLNELNDYTKEYDEEQIVLAETTAYLEANIKDKEEQVAEWTKRYNKEIATTARDRRAESTLEFVDTCVLSEKKTTMLVSSIFNY